MNKYDNKDNQDTSSEPKEFEVEKIIDKKSKKGKYFYKVKWKDYPLSEATWEPKENLKNAKAAILLFEKGKTTLESKKNAKAKRSKSPKEPEESDLNIDEEKENAKETSKKKSDVIEKKTEKKKMMKHLQDAVIKAESVVDSKSKEDDKDMLDDSNKTLDINLTYNNPSMKNLKIEYVKFIGDALYAYVSYFEEDSLKEKHKYLTTSELALLDPIKLIQFYESKVTFRAK